MSVSNIRSAAKFKQTVLLIDDQTTALDIHAAILKSLKLNVKIVKMTDPVEALAWMQNKQVDLIITDYRMHQMNGMAFVQAAKSASNDLWRRIIVVTALKDENVHQALLAAGASACFTKPVHAQTLANMVRTLLEKSQHHYGLVATH